MNKPKWWGESPVFATPQKLQEAVSYALALKTERDQARRQLAEVQALMEGAEAKGRTHFDPHTGTSLGSSSYVPHVHVHALHAVLDAPEQGDNEALQDAEKDRDERG